MYRLEIKNKPLAVRHKLPSVIPEEACLHGFIGKVSALLQDRLSQMILSTRYEMI